MDADLVTRNVVVDTEVFVRTKYEFDRGLLARLAELGAERWARVFITFVTIGEVEAQLREHCADLLTKVAKLQRQSPVFRYAGDTWRVHEDLDPVTLADMALAAFRQFMVDADAEVIPISDVIPEYVFGQYFRGEAPFSAGRKRCEFPDAFSLAAIRKWCKDTNDKVYVVSGDPDWARACEGDPHVVHLSDLRPFIEAVSKSSVRTALWRDAQKAFEVLEPDIKAALVEEITNAELEFDEIIGSVEAISISDVDLADTYIYDIRDDEVTFTAEARLALVMDMAYVDDRGSDVEMSVPQTWRVPFEVTIGFVPGQNPVVRELHADLVTHTADEDP